MDFFFVAAEPTTILNYFDLSLLLFLNILYYFIFIFKKVSLTGIQKITYGLLYLFILPLISVKIEIDNVYRTFTTVDGFNLLYTLFRIPIWWLIGFINYIIIKTVIKKSEIKSA